MIVPLETILASPLIKTPVATLDALPTKIIFVDNVLDVGVKPSKPVISELVAFAKTPEPLALTRVFPFTPLTVNPVNVGESAVPNPKFVRAPDAVAAPVPPFAIAKVPVAFEKSELILELNVTKSVAAK